MAFANMLSGFVESTSSCTSEHSLRLEVAYHPDLPHGAGLTILSVACFGFLDKIPGHLFESMAWRWAKNVDALPAGEARRPSSPHRRS